MKNQREIYEALLAGETLFSAVAVEPVESRVKLNDKDVLVWAESGREAKRTFAEFESWQIYKKPKWYENIPEGDVLCWVKYNENNKFYERNPRAITRMNGTHYVDRTGQCWMIVKPLTKQEIQVFMDNAPEDL